MRLERKAGTLTPGKEADIIMLRMDQINVMPVNNVYGAIVLGMDSSNVDTVLIGGKILKREGKLVGVDIERIRREVHQSRDYLVEKAGWPKTLFGGYLPDIESPPMRGARLATTEWRDSAFPGSLSLSVREGSSPSQDPS